MGIKCLGVYAGFELERHLPWYESSQENVVPGQILEVAPATNLTSNIITATYGQVF